MAVEVALAEAIAAAKVKDRVKDKVKVEKAKAKAKERASPIKKVMARVNPMVKAVTLTKKDKIVQNPFPMI